MINKEIRKPEGWFQKKLGEVAKLDRQNIKPEFISSGTLYIGLEHINNDGGFNDFQLVEPGELASNKFSFTKNHILYGKLRPYLKKIARPDFSGICSTDIIPILPSQEIDKDFLFYCLRQPQYIDLATTRSSGANLPRISPKELEKFPIVFPPIAQQKRIAAILDKADAVRRKRREAIRLTEELLRSTFLEMFGDPVTNTKNWNVLELGELISTSLQNGAYFPKSQYTENFSGTEMVHMSDAFYGTVQRNNLKRVLIDESDIKKYGLQEGDVLIARRSLTYEGAAKACLIDECDAPLIFESSLIRVRLNKSKILPIYFFAYMTEPRVREFYVFPFVTSSTISGINQTALSRINVVTPPISYQLKFSEFYQSQIKTLKRMKLDEERQELLFNSLLQRAFTGDL